MEVIGLFKKFIYMVNFLFIDVKICEKINGFIFQFFKIREMRYGCLFVFYLFFMVVEVFNIIVMKEVNVEFIKDI